MPGTHDRAPQDTVLASEILTDGAETEREDDSLHSDRLSTRAVAKRILRDHLWPRRRYLAGVLAIMAVSAATTGAMPFLLQRAVDEIFVKQQANFVIVLPILVMVIVTIKAASEYASTVGQAHIGNHLLADLRLRMFETLAKADLGWLQRTHSARFVSSFMNDVISIREAASMTLVALGQPPPCSTWTGGSRSSR